MAEELQFKCKKCGKLFEPDLFEAHDGELATVNRGATYSILVCRKCDKTGVAPAVEVGCRRTAEVL